MQLPHSKTRQVYTEQIKIVETNLRDATSGEKDDALLDQVQKRLDTLAKKYQYNEEIGAARYKMYELQALVHYFNGEDDDALDFINQAIETRGESYARAEKLKVQLRTKAHASTNADPTTMTKQERRKKLIGLEGWLAFFVVGIGLGIVLGIFNLFSYPSTFSDLESIRNQSPDFVSAIMPALEFELIMNVGSILLAIWLLFLLAKHQKFAKSIAIIYLASSAVFGLMDYTWVSSIFSNFNLSSDVQSELSSAAGDTGRSILAALIWVPYFLVSKRVKATLTK